MDEHSPLDECQQKLPAIARRENDSPTLLLSDCVRNFLYKEKEPCVSFQHALKIWAKKLTPCAYHFS